MKDKDLTDSIKADPFHVGLAQHGEFLGFEAKDKRADTGHAIESMTDEEIKASREKLSKMSRLIRNPQLLLTIAYVGTLLLMGKAYA
jgi:hypothetical protein